MARLLVFLALINIVLAVLALIDCLSAEEGEVRGLPRLVWVLVILLFSPIGPIAWFVAGRPVKTAPSGGSWRPGAGFPERERPRPLAPDDDPEFLAGLSNQSRREDEELLKRWEEDLKRREDDLKDQKQDGDEETGKP